MTPAPAVGNCTSAADVIRVGVSRCLLGDEVRYDGQHKRSQYAVDVLGQQFEFVAVCPEVEVGMPIPREPVRLESGQRTPRAADLGDGAVKMVAPGSGRDWTAKMSRFVRSRVRELAKLELSGFILQQKSPSCGMERVKVFGTSGMPQRVGSGLFAAELMKQLPALPVEEEGRLNDAVLRENFLTRVFAYSRLQQLYRQRWNRGAMVGFHADHKYLLMAHSPQKLKELGRLVAAVKQHSAADFRRQYEQQFMSILKMQATVRKNVNVLQHLLGYLKKKISADEKRGLLEAIDDYHRRLVPLIVPVTLLRHYFRLHPTDYLERQFYLNPHPKEWMLRNHV